MTESCIQMILLPGLDGTGTLFRPFLETAPCWAKLVVVAYPGNTIMDYPALGDYAEQFIDFSKPFVLLGESFSGPVAIEIASRKPDKLMALILAASFMRNPGPVLACLFSETLAKRLFALPIPDWLVKRLLLDETSQTKLLAAFKTAMDSVAPGVLAARLKTIIAADYSQQLAECTTPLLYLKAANDRLVTERSLQEINAVYPGITTAVVKAPHLVLQTRPEECWTGIEDFLQTHADLSA